MALAAAIFVAICDELLKYRIRSRIAHKARRRSLEDNFQTIITELRAANHKIEELERSNERIENALAGQNKAAQGIQSETAPEKEKENQIKAKDLTLDN